METLPDYCLQCREPVLVEAQPPCVLLDPSVVGRGVRLNEMYGMAIAQMRFDVELLHSLIVDIWATMPVKKRVHVIRLEELTKRPEQELQRAKDGGGPAWGMSVDSLAKVRSASVSAGWKLWPDEQSWDQSEEVLASCSRTFFIVLRDREPKVCKLYWFRPLRRGKTLIMGCVYVCNGCGGSDSLLPLYLCPGCQAVGYCSKKCGQHAAEECALLRARGFTKSLGGPTPRFEIKAFARP